MTDKVQKIIYLITKSNFGGAQKYVYELATEAQQNGHRISVVLGGTGALYEALKQRNVPVTSLNTLQRDVALFADIQTFIRYIRILRQERPDVVHINSSKAGALGVFAARIANLFGGHTKIIFTIHGWAFNENRSSLSKLFIKIAYLFIIASSHVSIAISHETKKQARTIPFSKIIMKKIVVIQNAIRPITFLEKSLSRTYIQEKIKKNISPETHIVGSLAELHPIKGLDIFIDAFAAVRQQYKDAIAVVCGEGQDHEYLLQKIEETGLTEAFFLIGFVKNAAQYLSGFDVYVSSSRSEGLSLVLLEARQAGIQIVATDVGGNKEALDGYENSFLIPPNDSTVLGKTINQALSTKKITNQPERRTFAEMYSETMKLYTDNLV